MITNDIDPNVLVIEDCEVKTTKYNGKYSKTALFLLPMVELSVRSRLVSKYLKNAFINDIGIEHDFRNPIFVLFKVKNLRERDWQDLCKAIITKELIKDYFVMDYYVGMKDGYHLVMYVFEVPDKYIKDYHLFQQGKYSLISEDYKAKFPEKILGSGGEQIESLVWGAMHKSKNLKKVLTKEFVLDKKDISQFESFVETLDEIWDSPKEEEEIYRYGTEQS